jgi:hypothetical protein
MSAEQIDLDDATPAAATCEPDAAAAQGFSDAAPHEVATPSRRLAALRRLMARPGNAEDAADYFARREAAKGAR